MPKHSSQRTLEIGIELEAWLLTFQLGLRPLDNLRIYVGVLTANLSGLSTGVSNPQKDKVWLIGPQLDVTGRILQFGALSIELGCNVWLAGNSPRFEVDPVGEIYRTSRFGGGTFLRGSFRRE
jgi:hypothetical protein